MSLQGETSRGSRAQWDAHASRQLLHQYRRHRPASYRVASALREVCIIYTSIDPKLILLTRIGEDAMFHLLTDTSVFIPLPNECLFQVTGDPIIHMKPPPLINGLHGLPHLPSTDAPKVNGLKRKASSTLPERPLKRLKGEVVVRTDSMQTSHGIIKHEPVRYVVALR